VSVRLSQLARVAYSCDVPQARKPRPFEHCGVCTSCLFRRSALFAALGRKDPTQYRDTPLSPEHSYERDAFLEQAHQFSSWKSLADVLGYSPNTRFALTFARETPHFSGDSEQALVRLFNRHGNEAAALFAHLSRSATRSREQHQESLHAIS